MGDILPFRHPSEREQVQAELDDLTVERSRIFRTVEEGKRKLLDINRAIAEKFDRLRKLAERARR
jgi:hypothetical protein